MLDALADAPTDRSRSWEARLQLRFEGRGDRTALASRRHYGPLAVQRPFYPESDGTCHAYVLHPPGGLVGGDRLDVEVTASAGARVLLTTPAATKFYRSAERTARQVQRLIVAGDCRLEWLPQESIVYEGSHAAIETKVELAAGAQLIAWDVLCLGRPAIGERFERGLVQQRLEILRDGAPLLLERACYRGGDDLLHQPFGLRGQPVVGMLVCVAEARGEALMAELRAVLEAEAPGQSACTELPQAIVCRYLGASVERAQHAFRAAWSVMRARCFGVPAVAPRIWAT
jgi:urease accessory protein